MNLDQDIQDWVVAFLRSRGDLPEDSLHDVLMFNYLDTELLDSFDLINMVNSLESTFNMQIDLDDMMSEEFATVGGLIRIVSRQCRTDGQTFGPR